MRSGGRCGLAGSSSEAGVRWGGRLLGCALAIGAVALAVPFASARQVQSGTRGEQDPAAAQGTREGDALEGAPRASAQAGRRRSWYASSVSRNEDGAYVVIHFWSKGARFRAETVVVGHRVTTIVNGETYYVLDPVSATGAAIERSPRAVAEDSARGRPFGNELAMILKDGGEKVGTQRASKRECEVYRVTDERGRRQVWVTIEEPRIPVRAENYDRASGRTTYVEYTDWLVDLSLSDRFFEPDERIDMERVGYEEYGARVEAGRPPGPAPVLYGELLHGRAE